MTAAVPNKAMLAQLPDASCISHKSMQLLESVVPSCSPSCLTSAACLRPLLTASLSCPGLQYIVVELPGVPPLLLRVTAANTLTAEEQQDALGYHCFRWEHQAGWKQGVGVLLLCFPLLCKTHSKQRVVFES
jgi:hypothetical protein